MKRITVTVPDALKRKLDNELDTKERNAFLVEAIKLAMQERERLQQPSGWQQFKTNWQTRWQRWMELM